MSAVSSDSSTSYSNSPPEIEASRPFFARPPFRYEGCNTAVGGTRVIPMHGQPQMEFDRNRIIETAQKAAGASLASIDVMTKYDAYYIDRNHRRPLPVIAVKLNDADRTRYYIDPKTARIAGSYSTRAWVSRWLYHGLHSLDFPWLYKYRPLWDIVVISLRAGGAALSVTSLVLAWRVMKRKLSALTVAT